MAPSRVNDDDCFTTETAVQRKLQSLNNPGKSGPCAWDGDVKNSMPRAWVGAEVNESQYLVVLTLEEREEAEQAARSYIESKNRFCHLTPSSFPLPTLGPRLYEARTRLAQDLGFFVLRGLAPEQYSNAMNIVLYVGISSYISTTRAIQYPGGPVLTHVVDLSSSEDQETHYGKWIGSGNQNLSLPFHTDNGHVLCLYSMHSVPVGGRSRLASSQKIIEILQKERPDIISNLRQDWQWDSTDVPGCNSFSEDEPTSTERPLLHEHNGHNFLNYSRRPLIGLPDYPRRTGLKPLTDAQIEALDTLESLANQLALSFEFKTGDIQYVNNLALLHGREAFQCQQPMGCRRHLLRMFLKNEGDDLSLPRELDAVIQGLYDHDVEEECFPWSLEPLPYILSP
ncbi:Clavaminate synthase-like protein [Apiospora kogelbergensis]|uniref:Clavaminate synthase-like protein n=1 Tax=Apiospora kogelbergensis TaxID=1337665 RepID=UPI00312F3686